MEIKKRSLIAIMLVFLLAGSIVGASALTLLSINTNRYSLWSANEEESNISISEVKLKWSGKNKVTFTITLTNDDGSNIHSTNCVLAVLDISGDVVIEGSVLSGDINPSDSVIVTIQLQNAGLQALYQPPPQIGLYDIS